MEPEDKEKKPEERKMIMVTRRSDEWEVKNEGDSAVLFSSREKEDAVKFARNMAAEHKVKLSIEEDEKKEDEEKEKSEKSNKRNDLLLIHEQDEWIVKNENDSAVLFSSKERGPALEFAKQMSKEHDVKVKEEEYRD